MAPRLFPLRIRVPEGVAEAGEGIAVLGEGFHRRGRWPVGRLLVFGQKMSVLVLDGVGILLFALLHKLPELPVSGLLDGMLLRVLCFLLVGWSFDCLEVVKLVLGPSASCDGIFLLRDILLDIKLLLPSVICSSHVVALLYRVAFHGHVGALYRLSRQEMNKIAMAGSMTWATGLHESKLHLGDGESDQEDIKNFPAHLLHPAMLPLTLWVMPGKYISPKTAG